MPADEDSHAPAALPLAGSVAKPLRPRFERVVLVCKACEKRSKGPKKLAARELAKKLGGAWRDAGLPRARVVLTGCLGACPKKAFTIAAAKPAGGVTMLAFRRGDDVAAAVLALFAE